MRLSTSGIVTNQYNDVLLILRDDSRTWAPPGGGIEANELPPEAAAREVEEETGVKVLPVRLVALQYMREGPDGELTLIFRCLIRGGEPTPSAESLQVGFHRSQELPKPMFSMHKQMLRAAIQHSGGPPAWHETRWPWGVRLARDLIYGYRNMRRRLLRRPPFVPPPTWRAAAFTMIVNPAGQILWAKRRDRDLWHLPGGGRKEREAPWETAIRETYEETGLHVRLLDLIGVYSKPAVGEIIFAFSAEIIGGALTPRPEAAEFTYFASGTEPENSLAKHVACVADLFQQAGTTLFRNQDD